MPWITELLRDLGRGEAGRKRGLSGRARAACSFEAGDDWIVEAAPTSRPVSYSATLLAAGWVGQSDRYLDTRECWQL